MLNWHAVIVAIDFNLQLMANFSLCYRFAHFNNGRETNHTGIFGSFEFLI